MTRVPGLGSGTRSAASITHRLEAKYANRLGTIRLLESTSPSRSSTATPTWRGIVKVWIERVSIITGWSPDR